MACLAHTAPYTQHALPDRGLCATKQRMTAHAACCAVMLIALQANDLASCTSVKELKWGSDVEGLDPPFDVIIASDLLYDMKSIPELMLTIVSLSSSDTVTYLAFELRPNVIRAAFQAIELYGLKAEQVRLALPDLRLLAAVPEITV